MLEELRSAFGLRDEDEVIAIGITFLVAIFGIWLMLRGCAPTQLIDADTDDAPVVLASNDAPTADVDRFRITRPDGSLIFIGEYEPNHEVDIFVDGDLVGRTRANSAGEWQFQHSMGQSGRHTLQVVGVGIGTLGVQSIEYPFDYSTLAETELTNTGETSQSINPRTLQISGIAPIPDADNMYIVQGSGLPNQTVTLFESGTILGEALSDADGEWAIDILMEKESVTLTAEQEALNGVDLTDSARFGLLNRAEQVVQLPSPTVTPRPTATAQLFATEEIEPTATQAPTLQPTATATTEPTSTPQPTETSEPIATSTPVPTATARPTLAVEPSVNFSAEFADIAVTSLASSTESRVVTTVKGEGPPGELVRILLGNNELSEVTIDGDGAWLYSVDLTLPPEQYRLSAGLVDERGDAEVLDENSIVFVVEEEDADETNDDGASSEGIVEIVFSAESSSTASDAIRTTVDISAPAVELILDASWSMRVALDADDTSRIGIAKEALRSLITDTLPDGIPVAYRAFGNIDGNYSCRTDLMLPLAPLNRETLLAEIEATNPIWNANTPIAASLAAVATDLAGVQGPITVVLLTDGEERCDGDPAAEITKLRESGIDIVVNIVGLVIDDDALKAQFAELAELGGGVYVDVSADSQELTAALERAMLPTFTVEAADGSIAARSVVGGAPVRLPAGDYILRLGKSTAPVTVTENETKVISIAE